MIGSEHGSSRATERKMGRALLGLLLMALVLVVGLLTVSPWLKETFGGPMANLVGAALALFMMSYATYFLVRWQRGLDEVQRASAGFAAQWGQWAGEIAFVALLLLPPFHDYASAVISQFVDEPGVTVDRQVVTFAMTFAFCAVVLLQSIALMIFSVIWWRSKQ